MSDIFAHAWSLVLGERYSLFRRILVYFGSYQQAWKFFEEEECSALKLAPESFYYIKELKRKINPEEEFTSLINQGISFLSLTDQKYPELLKHISQPPLILYYKGSLQCLEKECIAIVGTRKNTAYGKNCTRKIIRELVEQNITTVSGFAQGIDSLAHEYTIEYGGQTVAVLAHGLNTLYPQSNRQLAENIINANGLLLTEFSPKTHCLKHYFLRRNRIISGLSKATCVIECPDKSGAINTAQHAFDQNRNVYVVPGDIDRNTSQGPLKLMQSDKAYPIKDAAGMLLDLKLPVINISKSIDNFSGEESKILQLLSSGKALSLQEIYDKSSIALSKLSSILMSLELSGHVEKTSQGYLKILS